MKAALAAILLVSLIGTIQGVYPVCNNSLSCEANTCCRHSGGYTLQSDDDSCCDPPNGETGTCTPGPAQLYDYCGGGCQCDTGLECYRKMAGRCCEPHICYSAVWVQAEITYWNNCQNNDDCQQPP